jgi:hypothetical protein
MDHHLGRKFRLIVRVTKCTIHNAHYSSRQSIDQLLLGALQPLTPRSERRIHMVLTRVCSTRWVDCSLSASINLLEFPG